MQFVKKELTDGIQSVGYAKQSRGSEFCLDGTLNLGICFDVHAACGLVLETKKK